jgi:hypothetical protein
LDDGRGNDPLRDGHRRRVGAAGGRYLGLAPDLTSANGEPRVELQMHTPALQLDEEEHVQPSKPERLDREEITRDHRLGLRTEELTPAEPSPRLRGRHPGPPQDLPHRRRSDLHAHSGQLTNDPLISPAWVLTCNPQNELADALRDRGPAETALGVGPPSPNELAMPTQQGVRTDEERLPARSPKKPAGRSQKDTVGVL